MGGHAAGEVASAAVIDALRPLDTQVPAGELLDALDHAVRRASRALRDMAAGRPVAARHGHDSDRAAVVRLPAWPGAHRRLARLPGPRRRGVPDHPRPHDGAVAAGRRQDHGRRGDVAPAALAAAAGDRGGRRPRARPAAARGAAGDRYLLCSDGLHQVAAPRPSPGSWSRSATPIRPPETWSRWPSTAAARTTSPASWPMSSRRRPRPWPAPNPVGRGPGGRSRYPRGRSPRAWRPGPRAR